MFNEVPQLLSIFYFKRLMTFNVLEILDVDTLNYLRNNKNMYTENFSFSQ